MTDLAAHTETQDVEEVQPNLPKDFILTRVTIPLDGNTNGPIIRFDDRREEFVSNEDAPQNDIPRGSLYTEADEEREKCFAEMRRFAETFEIDLPDSQHLTWNHVESFMNTAVKQDQKGKVSDVAHKFLERVGDSGPAIQAWLDLLPSGEYSSLICGSFKLLITGAIVKEQLRKRIVDAISSIPGMLQDAKKYFDIYKSTGQSRLSIDLDKAFSKLVTAILSACICMFQYLRPDSSHLKNFGRGLKKYGKAVLKQKDYGDYIDEHIAAVKLAAEEVTKQASFGLHSRVGSIQGATRENSQFLLRIVEDNEKLKDGTKKLMEISIKQSEHIYRLENVLNEYYTTFKDNKRIDDIEIREKQYEAKAIEDRPVTDPSRRITQSILMNRLKYCHKSVRQDLKSAMSAGNTFPERDQERTQFVIYAPEFKAWLEAQRSELLIIEGNSSDIRISPMSFACALLATTMCSKADAIVLSYICGVHTTTKKNPTGPQIMLHSLLGQLLESYNAFDVSFLESPETSKVPKRLDQKDIAEMSKIFEQLIKQLPRNKVVFCIIDGISFYEYGANRDDNLEVFVSFAEIIRDQGSDAAFKLLITTPVRSQNVKAKIAKPKNVLIVPEEIPSANQGFDLLRLHRAGHKEMTDVKVRPPNRVKTGWSTQESERAEEDSTSSGSSGWYDSDDSD